MTPEAELLDAIVDRRAQVRQHTAWASGSDRIYGLLRAATKLRAMEITAGVETDVPWETVLAQLIEWHHELPLGEHDFREDAAVELVAAVAGLARLDALETSIRAGAYEVRRSRDVLRVRHRWDPAVEVADIYLEQGALPHDVPALSETERRWISTRPVDSRVGPPVKVLAAAVERAGAAMAAYRQALPEGYLPDSFALGDGLTVGSMARVLAVLMGLASLCEHTAVRLSRLESTLAHMHLPELHAVLAEMCPTVPEEHRVAAVQRLLFRRGRSARTSPLVRHGERIILCPPLLTPRAIDPIVLRSAASDFRRFGSVGRAQGERAAAWTEWLAGVPGTLVAERVPAYRAGGKRAGDLDVIAVDPVRRIGLCVEIKWPIDAVTSTEVVKIENWASSAARQLDRLRGELRSDTATAELPDSWPAFDSIDWTWCVGTPQQLCLGPLPVPNMSAISLRYLLKLGRPSGLPQVLDVLRNPVLPSEGVHFQIVRKTLRVGARLVDLDTIGISPYHWRPRFR
ncbi:hypothetical protein ACGF07_10365 [Kitasatospora sp. NPDC048194]|uniref:hypothetical protein n=1 Tax=Kitasatospora sp. NPDC048194 TaxID=3364045 RepID=UPI0037103923